jgi:hypothetical protein
MFLNLAVLKQNAQCIWFNALRYSALSSLPHRRCNRCPPPPKFLPYFPRVSQRPAILTRPIHVQLLATFIYVWWPKLGMRKSSEGHSTLSFMCSLTPLGHSSWYRAWISNELCHFMKSTIFRVATFCISERAISELHDVTAQKTVESPAWEPQIQYTVVCLMSPGCAINSFITVFLNRGGF